MCFVCITGEKCFCSFTAYRSELGIRGCDNLSLLYHQCCSLYGRISEDTCSPSSFPSLFHGIKSNLALQILVNHLMLSSCHKRESLLHTYILLRYGKARTVHCIQFQVVVLVFCIMESVKENYICKGILEKFSTSSH